MKLGNKKDATVFNGAAGHGGVTSAAGPGRRGSEGGREGGWEAEKQQGKLPRREVQPL